jgi:16S rRNA (cytidine1402-2'-O)-methyltransferase
LGTLYVVATPLGNLEDLTFRAARVLGEVGVIAAEDTRQTRKLLARYGIRAPLRSLHGHSREGAVAALVGLLREGQSVAYVSDAGTPGVSDPGAELVAAARQAGVRVVPLPGPSAPAAAISVAGLEAAGFLFPGYLPRRTADRREFLQRWTAQRLPIILFESPHRIRETLAELAALVPERQVVICREMTKQFEQIVAAPAAEAGRLLSEEQVRGEFTVVVEGEGALPARALQGEAAVAEAVKLMAEARVPRKTAAKVLQLLAGMRRNEAYRRAAGPEEG